MKTVHDFKERCELIKVEKAIDVRRSGLPLHCMVKWNYEPRYEFSKYLLDPLKIPIS